MPPRDWRIRINDILAAVRKIQTFTDDMRLEDFSRDERTIDAVIRNFTVIGEAAARVPTSIRKNYPSVPWAQMIGMRNIVVHEYFGVSLAIVWATARNRLPGLEAALLAVTEAKDKAPQTRKKPTRPRKSKAAK